MPRLTSISVRKCGNTETIGPPNAEEQSNDAEKHRFESKIKVEVAAEHTLGPVCCRGQLAFKLFEGRGNILVRPRAVIHSRTSCRIFLQPLTK